MDQRLTPGDAAGGPPLSMDGTQLMSRGSIMDSAPLILSPTRASSQRPQEGVAVDNLDLPPAKPQRLRSRPKEQGSADDGAQGKRLTTKEQGSADAGAQGRMPTKEASGNGSSGTAVTVKRKKKKRRDGGHTQGGQVLEPEESPVEVDLPGPTEGGGQPSLADAGAGGALQACADRGAGVGGLGRGGGDQGVGLATDAMPIGSFDSPTRAQLLAGNVRTQRGSLGRRWTRSMSVPSIPVSALLDDVPSGDWIDLQASMPSIFEVHGLLPAERGIASRSSAPAVPPPAPPPPDPPPVPTLGLSVGGLQAPAGALAGAAAITAGVSVPNSPRNGSNASGGAQRLASSQRSAPSVKVAAKELGITSGVVDQVQDTELPPPRPLDLPHQNSTLSTGSKFDSDSRKQRLIAELRRKALALIEHRFFKGGMMLCLSIALFGGGFFSLFDVPDDPGVAVLDTIMTIIMLVFAAEIFLTAYARPRSYPNSAFFWMDLLGTLSMVFEITYFLGTAGRITQNHSTVDTVVLRSARAAKLGARVGRLTKTVKCLASAHKHDQSASDSPDDVRVISRKLMLTLSTKVSLLALVLILVSPMFQLAVYPEADFSMRSWVQRLEVEYEREVFARNVLAEAENSTSSLPDSWQTVMSRATGSFERTVDEMMEFYSEVTYFPFKLEGFPEEVVFEGRVIRVPGKTQLRGENVMPARKDSIVYQTVGECLVKRSGCGGVAKAGMYLDFSMPKKMEAAMDMSLIVFMLGVMLFCTFDLSRTLDAIVLHPLQRMLGMVRVMTSSILAEVSSFEDFHGEVEDSDDENAELQVSEIKLLEIVLQKLAKLSAIFMQQNVVNEEEMAEMSLEGRGVILEMMELGKSTNDRRSRPSLDSSPASVLKPEDTVSWRMFTDRAIVDSWALNLLGIEAEEVENIIAYLFFDSALGQRTGRQFTNSVTLQHFLEATQDRYTNQPYHCYSHAIDVLHTVYRILTLSQSDRWLDEVLQYALMVSAVAHDVGHFGRTNQFLVETNHELALRYNDKSPLENMHCATLFEICSQPCTDVFKGLGRDNYSKARKVCITAILHTDNAHHFEMVKDISKIYELAKAFCDVQACEHALSSVYCEEVMQKNELTWIQLFLHLADVSNPLKPFHICEPWAHRVLDEFFDQGDEEKQLGIPVGMLNDREKICRPASQHNFINFLVAPLVFASVRIFQPLLPLADQMIENLASWKYLWIEETKPPPEEIAKKDLDIIKVRDDVRQLAERATAEMRIMRCEGPGGNRRVSVAIPSIA